ncbi:MAG: DUF4301 family protein [Crocinitomicaceae bacterium]
MPSSQTQALLKDQNDKVKNGSPKIKIIAPCSAGNGILKLDSSQEDHFEKKFQKITTPISYFVPASGSGSRMFDFLQTELSMVDSDLALKTKDFIGRLKEFSFYKALAVDQKKRVNEFSSTAELIDFILGKKEGGLGMEYLPKGLVPFHSHGALQHSAFYEHLIQGVKLSSSPINFHFTIQIDHKGSFEKALAEFKENDQNIADVSFSFQNPQTDSFVFDENHLPFIEQGKLVRRPSGHGALLGNLDAIQDQIVLVKNIDNVQHDHKSKNGLRTWRVLCGILDEIKMELKTLYLRPDQERLQALSDRFQLFTQEEIFDLSDTESFKKLINRPLRICGMVLNEGKAGGGPFYVASNGMVCKQIIEGAQVKGLEQQQLFESGTHFNPVMMALDTFDLEGRKFELQDFCNEEQYFIVNKVFKGKKVSFIERPGLWNGSMFGWNTIFIEVPADTFTPVKTILDLLNDQHTED